MNPSTCRTFVILLELVTILILSTVIVYQYMSDSIHQYAPVVELKHGGKVRGIIIDADKRSEVFLYEGIPFGTAERFQKPVAHQGWSGTFDATHPRDACPFLQIKQPSKHYTTNTYSEDCLYATVWVPKTPEPNELRPVMFYIYGGAFEFGTVFKESHDARYVAARGDVVVVGFNYRVGTLGFLYGGDDVEAPGNVGLWDQVLALKWVKANIHKFGGDPNKITVFGNSAGSQSIFLLMHSPVQTEKLFHRAILQSGGSMISHTKQESLLNAQQLARNFSCSLETSEMLRCLRRQSVDDILDVSKALDLKFKPIHGDKLFPVLYSQAVKEKTTNFDIDLMFGLVEDEGTGFLMNYFPGLYADETNLTLAQTIKGIPIILDSFGINNGFIIDDTINYYTSGLTANTSSEDLRMVLARIRGDVELDCPEILGSERWARHAPTKRYYSFRLTQRPLREANICKKEWMGVCHADELFYLFMIPEQVRESDRKLSQVMIRAWTLFARFGNPQHASNVVWEEAFPRDSPGGKITKYKTNFMQLEHDNYTMVNGSYAACEQFWYSRLQY